MKELLRQLPAIHELQKQNQFLNLTKVMNISPQQLTIVIQTVVDDVRERILTGESIDFQMSTAEYIFGKTKEKLTLLQQERITRVINATGTVLHTNLGRARLSEQAIRHVANVASNYSNLEYNLSEGSRGSRHDILEKLLIELTGAEAAMVVNNNAAAVFLVLRAFAQDKQVVVSRGQLVEIGGSFRVSSIMEESGAQLVEVGTTNKTHLYDYKNAITDETGIVLKVHTSNFKTIGFTESVTTEELVKLASEYSEVIVYEDLGSGSLYDFKQYGIGEEPVVKEVIKSGVDLVSFSGDKLLGGPQAGLIVGKKTLIDRLKKHQLARVLRVDKMTLAALEKTLLYYTLGNDKIQEIPTIRDILKPIEQIENQANNFILEFSETSVYKLSLEKGFSKVGGGTMPEVQIPTYVVSIIHKHLTAHELIIKLRGSSPSIVARIHQGKVIADFRTITDEEAQIMVEVLQSL